MTAAVTPTPTLPHKGGGSVVAPPPINIETIFWDFPASVAETVRLSAFPYPPPPPLWGRVGVGETRPMPHSKIDPIVRKKAKALRRNMTDAEMTLWRGLRTLEQPGVRIRRQTPIGPYIVDFACLSRRLIIEVDGGQHATDPIVRKDADRTEWLQSQRYRVIRFWNSDISENLDGVLETIQSALERPDNDF